MKKYLPVNLLMSVDISSFCTNNKDVSYYKGKNIFIECDEGPVTEKDLERYYEKEKLIIFKMFENKNNHKYVVQINNESLINSSRRMAGGNFIYTSDSRFRRMSGGYPLNVHDHIED